jgi:RND family efflux transporter MFP subunit
MPDKNPDGQSDSIGAGQSREQLLHHEAPPGLKRWGRIAAIAAVVIAVIGIALRIWNDHKAAVWADDQAVPSVTLVQLPKVKGNGGISLPGDVQAFTSAPIYAQVSGYVKKWYVDIGAHVKKGQLLAELDTPDIAGQAASARANLVNAQAAQKLSAATAQRWNALFAQGAVSKQDKDIKDADLDSKNAAVAAAKANLFSLSSQENFRRLVAPFDGVVTSRAVDVGNLVTVGNAATPLFTVADESRLRVYVRVPQNYAPFIHPGLVASFTVPQYPGRIFKAELIASAGAVAASTGTILVQFGIDNADGALQPGGYADVTFPLPPGANGVRVPATALIFRDAGMQVAVVDKTGHVKLKTVTITRDMGAAVDIGSGLAASDRIIDNPADSLQDGDVVRVAGK